MPTNDVSLHDEILNAMTAVARDELGSGFVFHYYQNFAGPFAAVAEGFVRDALEPKRRTEVAQAGERITTRRPLALCPACEHEILAEVSMILTEDTNSTPGDGGKTIVFTGKITGVRVNHDCIPKVTR